MIRAVLDANTLASGAVASGGTLAMLVERWLKGDFEVSISPEILSELERTLRNPYFSRRLDTGTRASFLAVVRSRATITPITDPIPRGVASHPEDDLVLAAATSAQADYLVTGDRQLQALGSYRGVTILGPRAFLDLLAAP